MQTGTVQVFVDDYVTGRLPPVCAVTGVPTTDQVEMRTNVEPLNPLWLLLIFLGPVGWIILLALAWSSGSYLSGWLPYSHDEASARRERRRLVLIGALIVTAGCLALAYLLWSGIMVGVAVAALIAALVVLAVLDRDEPRLSLDATRRWVTIGRVHPHFEDAVSRSSADQERSLPRR